MIITEEGTTNTIKWYQPESAEECKGTDCMKCVYQSYIPSSSSCPFEAWMINHPAKETAEPDPQLRMTRIVSDNPRTGGELNRSDFFLHELSKPASEYSNYKTLAQRSRESSMLKGCVKGEAIPSDISSKVRLAKRWLKEVEDEASANSLKVLDLFTEINQNIIKSIELQQEPANPKMVFKLEVQPEVGTVGMLDTLSYVSVGRKNLTSREYYHHCLKQRGRLIRLEYSYERNEYICPICSQVFVSK